MSNLSGLRRLVLLVITTGAMIAATLGLGASPAAAYGTCSVQLPSRLTVDAPFERFTARLGPDCDESLTDYASWDVEHTYYGPDDILIFDTGETADDWEFYDWSHYGTYNVLPSAAWDANYDSVSQNTLTTSVRLGSRLAFTSSRSGRYVTLRAAATRYTPSASGFRAWTNRPVVIYSRTCGTCSWKYFRTQTTDRYGKISTRFYQRYARDYQARVADVSNTWGRTATTRR